MFKIDLLQYAFVRGYNRLYGYDPYNSIGDYNPNILQSVI